MVDFGIKNALRNLGKKTPTFFVREMFAHGDQSMRLEAIRVLSMPDIEQRTATVLIETLKIAPEQEAPG